MHFILLGCIVDVRCSWVEDALRGMVILLDISGQKKLFDEHFHQPLAESFWHSAFCFHDKKLSLWG